MTLPQLTYRIATDPAFAAHLQQDPQSALAAAGLSLDAREIAALRAVLQRNPQWEKLCAPASGTPEGFPWWGAQFNPNPSSPA